ncbi:hypothetical protein [Streptomyces zagrosensis]|uniref:Uncharacterized protein YukE n=1 Tax=Streptomyces zagrosensis TaxID=1042984 RepID=A0A7W9QI28_9ACTN|nr:hypothetical protein [Streptomyces zagrosensis]MBB5940108.1 uncharacterized protein YukE [Streptomyces zagrosensis]
MAITEDIRKRIIDPTPLYVVAGAADLAAEKLREAPALFDKIVAEAPERIAAVRDTDPKVVQERVSQQAQETQAKLTELLGTLDTDIKKLRETAQDLTLQGVGRVAEYAVRARDTYDELAERGRGAVQTWRGEAAEEALDVAEAIEPRAKSTARTTAGSARNGRRIATPPPASPKSAASPKPAVPSATTAAPTPAAPPVPQPSPNGAAGNNTGSTNNTGSANNVSTPGTTGSTSNVSGTGSTKPAAKKSTTKKATPKKSTPKPTE